MANVYILVGYPGSGKSTKANKLPAEILSSDSIRAELYGSEEAQGNPKEVFDTLYNRMEKLLCLNENVCIDATNINKWERKRAIEIANRFPCVRNLICIYFNIPIEECKKRNALRERRVPDFVYDKMQKKFECPSYEEGFNSILTIYE